MLDQLVTPETRRHGDYRIAQVSVTEGEHGKDVKGEQSAVVNYDCDPVKRWFANGNLDQRQAGAVDIYRWAHRKTFGSPSTGTNWYRLMTGTSGAVGQYLAETSAEAMDDLRRADELLRRGPPYVLTTWVNVVIYGLAAGPAGELLSHKTARDARAATLTIVRLCCDMIAQEWGL